jgi:hypothetical protein
MEKIVTTLDEELTMPQFFLGIVPFLLGMIIAFLIGPFLIGLAEGMRIISYKWGKNDG